MDNLSTIIATIIVAIIGSSALSALVVAWANRRKTTADTASILTAAARELMDDMQERYDLIKSENESIRSDIKLLQAEMVSLENALENLASKYLKLELATMINISQIRAMGIEPLIDTAKIDSMSIDELRLTAEGSSNAARRRERAYARKQAQEGE